MKWLEFLSQRATDFVSSHWGTLTALGILGAWLVAIPLLGSSNAWGLVDKVIFATSFLLLFLLQRSQTKATLSIQLKLNELLASAHRASPQMINIEDKSEEEVRELHDRYQEIQQIRTRADRFTARELRVIECPLPSRDCFEPSTSRRKVLQCNRSLARGSAVGCRGQAWSSFSSSW